MGLATVIALVTVSPLGLGLLDNQSIDWDKLATIGQAYGGISAILSALALCAIAVSLVLQWRQARADQIVAARERHFDLVMLSLQNPDLVFNPRAPGDAGQRRVWMHSNLWMLHWLMLRNLDMLHERGLRRALSHMFDNEDRRVWWATIQDDWSGTDSADESDFLDIVKDEYARALQRHSRGADITPNTELAEDSST
jgi:hypothetical protein